MGRRRQHLSATIVVALLASACGGGGDAPADPTSPASPTASASAAAEPSGEPGGGGEVVADGLYWAPPVAGAQLTYATDGPGGAGEYVVEVDDVATNGDGTSVTATIALPDADGGTITVTYTTVTTPDGGARREAASFAAGNAEFTLVASGDDIAVPSPSELLSGGSESSTTFVELESDGNRMRMDLDVVVTGDGTEQVTVPAGTFDALVVVLEATVTTPHGTAVNRTRSWLVPGFAVVRNHTEAGGFTITEELTASSIPLPG